jgi:hypothetical protein
MKKVLKNNIFILIIGTKKPSNILSSNTFEVHKMVRWFYINKTGLTDMSICKIFQSKTESLFLYCSESKHEISRIFNC